MCFEIGAIAESKQHTFRLNACNEMVDIFVKQTYAIGFAFPAIGVIATVASSWFFKCNVYECCNDSKESRNVWIRYDDSTFKHLDLDMRKQLHGQPLVRRLVLKAVRSHWKDEQPVKPLVLSFHGWTGSGKNFVSDIIAERLFKKGKESRFVHRISGPERFPDEKLASVYKQQLMGIVSGNVSSCGRQLFIIDEVDKIPPGVIDGIKPFLDYKDQVNGVDYRKAIFIFLSNTGGKDITRVTYDFWKKGKSRDEITLKDIEPLMNSGAFNEMGGLQHSNLIRNNLIDYFIPFLPLEREHVKLCIRDYIVNKFGESRFVDENILEKIADEMEYFPPDLKLYSKSGCKKVHTKVSLIIDDDTENEKRIYAIGFALPLLSGITASGAGAWLYYQCTYTECCNNMQSGNRKWIRQDDETFKQFDRDLKIKLHGQHLVRSILTKDENPVKPLVLSFHGWTGSGKNFVANMIAERLFEKGKGSKFVHRISGPERFPDETLQQLMGIVSGNVSMCGRQLFIIDEVDKIPPGIIDGIKSFLDYNDHVNGVDYRKAIFIFISNTGGTEINRVMVDFYKRGINRRDVQMKNLTSLIEMGAFNEKGGFQHSSVVKNYVIDHFVPFLPLEREHVKLCIDDYIVNKFGESRFVDENILEKIADELEYFPPDLKLYSRSGCKKVHTKVPLFVNEN
ncbi:hypothetical protein B4U80_00325 [Leptotrombidium deliense]|uniref:AAA+ ATPase domain-containing protein n=1 Tax=Leptotrombidium deliense TaxID=299467 RepID=A0A443SIB1_9ACAR|nr:hypothetical protein B4U80_00325 [Leptotrombidium deliense]